MRLIFDVLPLAAGLSFALLGCRSSPELAPNQLVAEDVYSAIRTDGTFVYYVDVVRDSNADDHTRLVRVSVAGGDPEPLAELPKPHDHASMAAFVIDGTTAYCPVEGAIVAVPLAGGPSVTLVDDGAELVQSLAVDDTALYWVEGSDPPPWGRETRLVTMPKQGGVPTVLVGTGASVGWGALQIAVDGAANVYWPRAMCDASAPPDCIFYNTVIYSTSSAGASSVWASAQADVQAVATDGTSLFWLTADHGPSNGTLLRAPIATPSDVTILAQSIASPWSSTPQVWGIQIADATTVLWLDAVGRVYGIKNGQPVVVADGDGTGPIKFFTTDSVNVYWATSSGIFRTMR